MATSSHRVSKSAGSRSGVIEERRALLQRVLWSRHIEKSTRIRDLLAYVSERALEEPAAEIHEQEIGCRVFGRPSDYDTTADNIVRVTASQARKKLEQYFAGEGVAEPVILEIPKGQYAPVFRDRTPAAPPPNPAPPVEPWPERYRRLVLALAASAPLFAALALWSGIALRNARLAARSELDSSPALHSFWPQFLPREGRTDIVVTDSSLSLFQELLDRQLTLPEYLKPDLWMQANGLASNPELQSFAQRAAQRRFTSLGSVTTAYRIAQLAGRNSGHVSLLSARDFNIRQMKEDSVILLGSSRANPWVELIADRLNFRFGYDQKRRYSYFENLDPYPGELKLYQTDSGVSYCRIAFLPNLSRTGSILAISGTEVEGTEGGGEFMTSERLLGQLRAALGTESRWPYFEVLLNSTRVGGSAPGFHLVATRVLKP